MKYRYIPIIKYLILIICVFLFIKHSQIVSLDKNLFISTAITIITIILDYMLIENQPSMFEEPVETFDTSEEMHKAPTDENDDENNDDNDNE